MKYQKYDNSKVSIPLYKYYGQLEYARSAIENKQIHFENPDSYNDIFDSALKITKQRLYTAKLGTFLKKEGLQNFFSLSLIHILKAWRWRDLHIRFQQRRYCIFWN